VKRIESRAVAGIGTLYGMSYRSTQDNSMKIRERIGLKSIYRFDSAAYWPWLGSSGGWERSIRAGLLVLIFRSVKTETSENGEGEAPAEPPSEFGSVVASPSRNASNATGRSIVADSTFNAGDYFKRIGASSVFPDSSARNSPGSRAREITRRIPTVGYFSLASFAAKGSVQRTVFP